MSKNSRKNVYNNRKKSGNGGALIRFILTLAVLSIVVFIFICYAFPIIKNSAKKAAAEKTVDVITENIDAIAGDNEQIKEVVDKMSEEDKETVTEIVTEHMDTETMTEVMDYVNKKDKDGLVRYATENLSEEEISELLEIYSKYSE